MSTENKPKSSKTVLFLSLLLVTSLVFNGIQFVKISGETQKAEGEKVEYTRYMSALDSICNASMDMDQAKAWIAEVNKEGILFNNKSIFICKDAIKSMIEATPDYTGIFVRRGMDSEKVIHDLGWVGVAEGSSPAPNAYILEWQSCACPPCCGDDTSDYRDYTGLSHAL